MTVREGSAGLPEFFEVRLGVVLGVFHAVGCVSALAEHVRALIGPLLGVIEVKETADGGVGLIDVFRRDTMTGQREETDVLQRIAHVRNKAVTGLATGVPVAQITDLQAPSHLNHR